MAFIMYQDGPLSVGCAGGYERLQDERRKHMDIIKQIEEAQMKTDVPEFRPGDTVRIEVKVVEGNRERLQAYEGVVIKRVGKGLTETFTVRRTAYGVTSERIFPIHSPRVASIKVVRQGRIRRAKLYYMRDRYGKAARIKEIHR